MSLYFKTKTDFDPALISSHFFEMDERFGDALEIIKKVNQFSISLLIRTLKITMKQALHICGIMADAGILIQSEPPAIQRRVEAVETTTNQYVHTYNGKTIIALFETIFKKLDHINATT